MAEDAAEKPRIIRAGRPEFSQPGYTSPEGSSRSTEEAAQSSNQINRSGLGHDRTNIYPQAFTSKNHRNIAGRTSFRGSAFPNRRGSNRGRKLGLPVTHEQIVKDEEMILEYKKWVENGRGLSRKEQPAKSEPKQVKTADNNNVQGNWRGQNERGRGGFRGGSNFGHRGMNAGSNVARRGERRGGEIPRYSLYDEQVTSQPDGRKMSQNACFNVARRGERKGGENTRYSPVYEPGRIQGGTTFSSYRNNAGRGQPYGGGRSGFDRPMDHRQSFYSDEIYGEQPYRGFGRHMLYENTVASDEVYREQLYRGGGRGFDQPMDYGQRFSSDEAYGGQPYHGGGSGFGIDHRQGESSVEAFNQLSPMEEPVHQNNNSFKPHLLDLLSEEELQERIENTTKHNEKVAKLKLQKISTFVIKQREDAYSQTELMDNYLLDKVDQARISAFEMKKLYQESDYAFRMEIEQTCPEIIHRQEYSAYLRPVYIDGCGVSMDFISGGTTYRNKIVEKENTIPLMMYPIVQTLLVYILMGHKAVVIFPKRYKELLDVDESSEVDRLDVFKKLYMIRLLQFWERPPAGQGNIVDAMIDEYSKIGAGIVLTPQGKNIQEFTKAHVWHIKNDKYRGYKTEHKGGHTREIVNATIFPEMPVLSRHLLMSVIISGGKNDFVFISATTQFFYSVERNAETQKRKYTYLNFVKPQKLFYTPMIGDITDVQIKKDNQITIKQQVNWVMELIKMYELPSPHMYAVMILFRFLYKEKLCMGQIRNFMEDYPILKSPPPITYLEDGDIIKRRQWNYMPDLATFENIYTKWKQSIVTRMKFKEDFERHLERKEKPPSPRATAYQTKKFYGNYDAPGLSSSK